MISVGPQSNNQGILPFRGRPELNTEADPTQSARDLPRLHEETKQHPELSKYIEITDPNALKDIKGTKAILDFYKVGTEKASAQVFNCDKQNHLIAVLNGPEAYEQLFKGGAYTVTGMGRFFGGFSRNIGKKYLNSSINLVNQQGQKIRYSQIKTGLKSGELRAVAVYEQDPVSKKYSKRPKAIAILDKSRRMIENLQKEIPESSKHKEHYTGLLEEAKHDGHLQKLYQCSLFITDPKAKEHISKPEHLVKTAEMVAEVCPKEWQILFPMKLFDDATDDQSLHKDYQRLKWRHPVKKDGKWTHEDGYMTLARARENSQEAISDLLPFLNNQHSLLETDAAIHLSEDGLTELKAIAEFNRATVRAYNEKRDDSLQGQAA